MNRETFNFDTLHLLFPHIPTVTINPYNGKYVLHLPMAIYFLVISQVGRPGSIATSDCKEWQPSNPRQPIPRLPFRLS